MENPDIGHRPGTRDSTGIDDFHTNHTYPTAISYGCRAGTAVSGGLWRSDWQMVSGPGMGISERIDEYGTDAWWRRNRTPDRVVDGNLGLA